MVRITFTIVRKAGHYAFFCPVGEGIGGEDVCSFGGEESG